MLRAADDVVGGVAFATWFEEATGSGTANAADLAEIEVENVVIDGDPLKPGAVRDLKITVKNPNDRAVKGTLRYVVANGL